MRRRGDNAVEPSLILVTAFTFVLRRVVVVADGAVAVVVVEEHVVRAVVLVVRGRVVLTVPLMLVRPYDVPGGSRPGGRSFDRALCRARRGCTLTFLTFRVIA